MKKVSAPLSLFVAAAMVVSVCGFTGTGSQKTLKAKDSGSVTFTAINGGTTEVKAFTEILNGFSKYTGINAKLEELPSSNDYENIIKTRFATNDPPDIFYWWSGSNQYTNLSAGSRLVNMTSQSFVKYLTPAIKSYQTVSGKIYGMPWGSYNSLGVYYNKKIFAKYKLSVPKTYADFLKICKTLKSKKVTPIYEAGGTVWPTQIFTLSGFTSFVIPSIGGNSGVVKITNNKLKLNNIPALKDVAKRYVALKTKGYLNSNYASATYDQQEKAIATGKAAMIFQADWCLPDIQSKYKAGNNIDYFPLPNDKGTAVAALYPPKQIFVSKNSKNVAAALRLIKYMSSKSSLNTWYKYNPGIVVYKNATSKMYASQKTILNYINKNKGDIQIQLRTNASFTDFDKLCQNLLLTGNVTSFANSLSANYIKDGKNKGLKGF